MTKGPITDISIAAMLKAAIDEGKDYVEMCVPVLMGAIEGAGSSDYSSTELEKLVSEQLAAPVPRSVVETIATRCVKRGYLRRDGGRWFITGKSPKAGERKVAIEEAWQKCVAEFIGFARSKGVDLVEESAGEILIESIKDNRVGLLIGNSFDGTPETSKEIGAVQKALVGQFFQQRVLGDTALLEAVFSVVAGLVLRATIFLGDTIASPKRLASLVVYIDSTLAFALIGIGIDEEIGAVQQGALLLRRNGVTLRIFDKTVDEMNRVLAIYQGHLGTAAGIRSLYKTNLTQHFLQAKATPGDVAAISASLERRLREAGVALANTPPRAPAYTLSERALEAKLARKGQEHHGVEKRVLHDIDCIAGILTLRAGRVRNRIEDCGFIFSTIGWLTAKNVQEWYREQGGLGFSPCVNHGVLTTLSWLQNPTAGAEWVKAGIGSLASLASTVSEEAWSRFKRHLKKLADEGGISTDEELQLLASKFAEAAIIDEALSRGDDPDLPDARTIADAIERVKLIERDKIVAVETRLYELQNLGALRDSRRIIFAHNVASLLTWTLFAILMIVSIWGLWEAIPRDATKNVMLAISTYSLLGLAALFLGGDVRGWRRQLESWISNRLLDWLP